MKDEDESTRRFNALSRGRCRDKFLAMKHVCGLSDLQYDILIEKWCDGRTGLSRYEMASMHHISERTLDREYRDAKRKILDAVDRYGQDGYSGRFFFELDMELTGYDWSDKIKD